MAILIPQLIAIFLYAASIIGIYRNTLAFKQLLFLCISPAFIHFLSSLWIIFSGDGLDLSLFSNGSLIASLAALIISFHALRNPVLKLLLVVQPVAIAFILFDALSSPTKIVQVENGVAAHILFSISAYGIITVSAVCAAISSYASYNLKHKNISSGTAKFPPLETTDKLLFEMVAIGQLFLTASIATGFLYFEDFFAQKLSHKTFFSLVSWVIFGLIILGHFFLDWRGIKAARWTMIGFGSLILAYFGSKFVLEIILA